MNSPANNLKPRPPIVVVMGHVDHGKTTLLDHIRKANVAAREAGGITQSIGAYEIEHNGKRITFIDTPGHEAFSKMRTRGASAADLAILVVAADESLKPQTHESIKILMETRTPFVVAITKTDKNTADVDRVKNDLTSAGVLLEGYGGSVSYQPVSAQTGENIDDLLDLILLAAEVENLTYDPALPASGYVLETRVDRRRGMEAAVIVKNGTLKQGEAIATSSGKGKARIVENFLGKAAKQLEPSSPALIIGWEELPQVGEEFVTGDQAQMDLAKRPEMRPAVRPAAPLANQEEDALRLTLVAADMGSLEALSQIVRAMGGDKPPRVVHESVGDVTDGDVNHAISTGSIIISFKSRIDKGAKMLAEANRIRIISSEIVYDLVKAVEDFLTQKEKAGLVGVLEVLAVFNQTRPEKQVVGGRVAEGVFRNRAQFEIERAGQSVGSGRVTNLQQAKQDTNQVAEGNEAGLMVSSPTLVQVGDRLVIRATE
jgi:translation initiation factor IF-2